MEMVAGDAQRTSKGQEQRGRYFLGEEAVEFRTQFNLNSFEFHHRLAGHPLFEMPRLVQLAKTCAKHPQARADEVYYDAGDIKPNQRWSDTPHPDLPPEVVLERIHTSGAWMMIRRAELVEEYRLLLDECMAEIQDLLRLDLDAVMEVKNAIVFITSPRRITTYHIDRECNFLLQISGDKSVSVFDAKDRIVLPDEEIERFWAVDNNAAVYKPEHQNRAHVYPLIPGTGVHIPVNAPHWVTNGESPSVSLSINFQFRARSRSDVYRTNFYLRRMGIRPSPPGESVLRDAVKRFMLPAVRGTHELVHVAKDRLVRVVGRRAGASSLTRNA
jgi:hypothetical protein